MKIQWVVINITGKCDDVNSILSFYKILFSENDNYIENESKTWYSWILLNGIYVYKLRFTPFNRISSELK